MIATDRFQSPSLRGSGRFARARKDAERRAAKVSIPFIAGQWSLQFYNILKSDLEGWFQSPSLRGSGRFQGVKLSIAWGARSFNPLHCGAVVASGGRRGAGAPRRRVSIPFIAGQWSLQERAQREAADRAVSIPFIAGQWSLREARRAPSRRSQRCFNPLHCGAVVASRPCGGGGPPGRRVSIPFIAGQWSLPLAARRGRARRGRFQSPSLRGSGRFRRYAGAQGAASSVSIPFIAGQWSLRS